jgi:hypothetical protein
MTVMGFPAAEASAERKAAGGTQPLACLEFVAAALLGRATGAC